MFKKTLTRTPVIGILRGIFLGQESECIEACDRAGLKVIEVTMNTENAPKIIKNLKKQASSKGIYVGAGTVRNLKDLETAINAGADFIVTPTTSVEVIKSCVEKRIPIIPGALTPTEIELAYTLGATYVKVFPVSSMGGASYIRDLRGPLKDIPLMACGGVSASNALDYKKAGANLFAFGASIFNVEWMQTGQWQLIEVKIKEFLQALEL
jgi:2-dehydro-3-deoxyphosphogluconate aldolase/(4S)-4-hydroxy-2-oxoglutarate aldolase